LDVRLADNVDVPVPKQEALIIAERSLPDMVDIPTKAVSLIIFGLIDDQMALEPPTTVKQADKTVGLKHSKVPPKKLSS
jgi:hypothetical protein